MRQWRISEAMEGGFITVVETPHFNSLANKHLTEAERQALASTLAHDATQGDRLVQGSGIRKLRFARGGRGKSGGIQVVYFYHSPRMPLFLLTLFAKNERDNLKSSEVRILGEAAKALARRYGDGR